MKQFIDKLIGRLEEETIALEDNYGELVECIPNDIITDIVNQLVEEYNGKYVMIETYKQVATERDIAIEQLKELGYSFGQKIAGGWIPCSERLPDDFMSMEYLTTVKGCFYSEINYYCVVNHKWYSNERTTKEVNVIAWMPKPTVYQPKGE